MADQNRCAVSHDLLQFVKDLFFRVGIDTGQRIIQNQNLRIADNRSRNCRPLLLASGQRNTALTDDSLILIRKALHIGVDMRNPGRPLNVRVGSRFDSEGDVLANGLAEKKRVLRNKTDCAPQCVEGNLLDRNTIDE